MEKVSQRSNDMETMRNNTLLLQEMIETYVTGDGSTGEYELMSVSYICIFVLLVFEFFVCKRFFISLYGFVKFKNKFRREVYYKSI